MLVKQWVTCCRMVWILTDDANVEKKTNCVCFAFNLLYNCVSQQLVLYRNHESNLSDSVMFRRHVLRVLRFLK